MTEAAMIFAAGFGTRMGDLTRSRPKPLIPVAGVPLLDRAIGLVRNASIPRIVVNTHYLAGQIENHLAKTGIAISREMPDILDTGGGLRAALPLLSTDVVFTINPDVLWFGPNPLDMLRDAWNPDKMDALLMTVPLPQTHGRGGGGDFALASDGKIRRGGELVYGGAQILNTRGLSDIPDRAFSLNLLWDRMNQTGRLHLATYPGEWCDVGKPENIAEAEALLARHDV